MGIRGQNSIDRLRTVWTPEMDHYFIDLMLEQVGKGNRIDDHLFSKRAWKHMTSLFNAKFKFQYEKDVLKNRHKTLRNLYKSVKNLLDQGGFSWDDTRKMVTADNNVWDEYIKAHPDARSYRIKTIPYYSDLCLIYKNANTKGKDWHSDQGKNILGSEICGYLEGIKSPATPIFDGRLGDNLPESSSQSTGNVVTRAGGVDETAVEALHEIMINEDYGFSVSKEIMDDAAEAIPNVLCTTAGSRARTYWQPPMDRYFIDLMLEQVQKGNQIDGLFRKQAWMEMIASFNAKFGSRYDIEILKNRYKTLRRQYNVIKNLLELNGFSWDDARQMVTADDYVWQDYIKAHTDARQYMTRPIPYYKDLCVICRDLSDDGRECISGQILEQEDEVPEVKFGGALRNSESLVASTSDENQIMPMQEPSHVELEYVFSDQKSKRLLESLSHSPEQNKARRKDEGMAGAAMWEMATIVSSLADKTKEDENPNSLSIEHVIEAVQALPDMDEDLVLDACDLLEDEKKAKTFLALDIKLRKKWLLRKLRPNNL
ncbi:uncharacterized protein LOC131155288 [Malania oleifera]|uniref:uncharacterized protein LOC131155288 n=1 Tax=Malania oleifera TaxID=397392 RepID=UPI0025ADFCC5|nr:uncharacterized protein LOC131155288 [Malania oleifera]